MKITEGGGWMLGRFLELNRRICRALEEYFPQAKLDVYGLYNEAVAKRMNSTPGQIVADVGGGKSCSFAKHRVSNAGTKIIAVDVSEEELKGNLDVDEARVADVTRELPFSPEEVDLIASSSVLEHLSNLEGFIANSGYALKSGGYSIHYFPCKFAPFAVINQLLPRVVSRKLLFSLRPEMKGVGGFPAFYDNCYYSAITALLEKHGFDVVDVRFSYYQSPYYFFFVPLFLLSALYELIISSLKVKNLSAYMLVVARKK
jgi:ubiquinone/menaquinone biosynthesis C-methylase UbiE